MPVLRRIPKKIRSKRAIHAVRTRTKYIIAKTQPRCNYKTFKFSQHTKKSTRVSPSACALPDAAHATRALFPPKLAFGKEGGQACRSRPHKIPHKSPALPDFYTAARAAAARPPLPCRGEGGIVFGFSGTENVSRGDSVPPRLTQPSHTSSCSPLRGRASSILMPSFADRPPYSTPYIASVIGMETPCCCARW